MDIGYWISGFGYLRKEAHALLYVRTLYCCGEISVEAIPLSKFRQQK